MDIGVRVPILWQNTVVDIQPTSRYDERMPDTAMVSTTIGYESEGVTRTQTYLDSVPVFSSDARTYRFAFDAPIAHTELLKNSDISVVVLLPRMTSADPELSRFKVVLESWSPEQDGAVFGDEGRPSVGARAGVAWHWTQDPESIVEYIYDAVYHEDQNR